MAPKPKFNKDQSRDLRKRHEKGERVVALAKEFQCGRDCVANAIRRAGGVVRNDGPAATRERNLINSPLNGIADQEVADFYTKNGSEAAEKRWKASRPTILAAVRRAGVDVRRPGRNFLAGSGFVTDQGYKLIGVHPDWQFYNEMAIKRSSTPSFRYVLEHRKNLADFLGRPLRDDETVHHIDGDKLNNDPSNLQLRQGRHGKGAAYYCADCGSKNVAPDKLG